MEDLRDVSGIEMDVNDLKLCMLVISKVFKNSGAPGMEDAGQKIQQVMGWTEKLEENK